MEPALELLTWGLVSREVIISRLKNLEEEIEVNVPSVATEILEKLKPPTAKHFLELRADEL